MSTDTNHSRRDVLALAGVTLGATALAGCTGSAADQESNGTGEETNGTDADEAGDSTAPGSMDGLVTVERDDDVETAVDAITGAIEANERLTLMTTVDHAENAASVDRSLPPTTLILFGNPELGTQLMTESRTVGLDLPQKFLVYELDGETLVTYNDPEYLADRHDLTEADDVLETIAGALENLAAAPSE